MPRGRHRHSPPLHRLLPPSAIAGVSLVCALGPWAFTEPAVLRVSAAVAAATAAVGASVMRRWDVDAGKRVADLTRARAGDEWRHEERVAELETDLEESRELRQKLEHKLRAKRAELQALRNEHAALLRRYATAETERASALEGRRLLALEASTVPAPALAPTLPGVGEPAASAAFDEGGAVAAASGRQASGETVDKQPGEAEQPASGVFSPPGSSLFLRADSALNQLFKGEAAKTAEKADATDQGAHKDDPVTGRSTRRDTAKDGSPDGGSPREGHPEGRHETIEGPEGATIEPAATATSPVLPAPSAPMTPADAPSASARGTASVTVERMPSAPAAPALHPVERPALLARPAGHFTVPTAVAVVPASPYRRPAIEGGFDFFGRQKGAAAIEAVQNEDLADVVGQEALALHKADAEARFKSAAEESRGIGQVIDLTAHDETEEIDVEGLRSVVS